MHDAAGSRAATSILVRPMSVRHPRMPASGTPRLHGHHRLLRRHRRWRSSCSSSCPQRRQAAARRALIASPSRVGDEVVTIGGIFGTIRAVDDDRIELEVAPGVLITVARDAIAQAANPAASGVTTDPSHDEHARRQRHGDGRLTCASERRLPGGDAGRRGRRPSSSRSSATTNRCSASTCRAASPSCSRRSASTSPTRSTWPSTSSATGSTAFGVAEPEISRQGTDIVIDLPGREGPRQGRRARRQDRGAALPAGGRAAAVRGRAGQGGDHDHHDRARRDDHHDPAPAEQRRRRQGGGVVRRRHRRPRSRRSPPPPGPATSATYASCCPTSPAARLPPATTSARRPSPGRAP